MGPVLSEWLSQYQSLCLITLTLLVERWLVIPSAWHPLVLVRSLAQQLAAKVHHPERHDPHQQRTAGTLACLLMLLLCVPLPLLLRELTPFPYLVDGVILLLCLSWRPMSAQLKQVAKADSEKQKQLRRTLLSTWLARDCDRLSEMGLNKAAIEAIYLRSWHDQVAVLFWYLIAGSWAALTYRVLLEVSRCWHPKKHQMADFALFSSRLRAGLDFFPQQIWALWLLFTTFRKLSKVNRQQSFHFDSKPRGLLLLAANAQHNCDLGGPALYEGKKCNRPRLAGRLAPQAMQIEAALGSINLRLVLLLALIWLVVLTRPLWLP